MQTPFNQYALKGNVDKNSPRICNPWRVITNLKSIFYEI